MSESVSYASLFAQPGRAWFVLATSIGRMPSAMKALACILLVQQLTGSYGLAGLVGAAQTMVAAICAPIIGQLIDRHGEKQILTYTALAHVIGVIWVIAAAYADVPAVLMLIGAGIIGASSVQFGSLSRARWAQAFGRGRALDKAYALESMIDEMGFVIGPVLVVLLSVDVHPAGGLIASLAMTLIGSFMLMRSRLDTAHLLTENDLHRHHADKPVVLIPAVMLIVISMFFMGILFGAAEIVLVSFAEAQGHKSAASYMAAIFAIGSLLGALLYGAVHWRGDPRIRLLISYWWIGLGAIPILLAPTILWMCVAVFVCGLAISPGMIVSNSWVEQVAPRHKLTEAFAWLGSSLASGAAVGSIAAGHMVDHMGFRGGQWVSVIGGLACGIAVTLGWRILQEGSRHPDHSVA